MQCKKIFTVLIPCLIITGSIAGTSGYAFADKQYGWEKRHSSKETRKHSSKKSSDRRVKRDHESRHFSSRHRPPGFYDRQRPERRHTRPHYQYRYEYYNRGHRPPERHSYRLDHPRSEHFYRKGKRHTRIIVIPSRRYHDHYIRVRPFRYAYPRYRPLYYDNKFWGWLAFTVVTLQILDHLNDDQRHEHEAALYRATRAPIGKTIVWVDSDDISGSVTPVWEGSSDAGQHCREFRHEITIDERTEIAYGTACKRSDDTWEIVQ